MRRTLITQNQVLEQEMVANAMLLRRELLEKLMDPRRDINKECGYPETIEVSMYAWMYEREVGKRVVDIYPDECWQSDPEVLEEQGDEHTPWEEEFIALEEKHNLFEMMNTVDRISGIGRYGILVFGINDGKELKDPVDGIDPKTGVVNVEVKQPAKRELLYVQAFDESVVEIASFEGDRKSPRYGQPKTYNIRMSQSAQDGITASSPEYTSVVVHWTRCVHVADNCKNSKVFGTPRMKYVFNRLLDLRKVGGGSGEMFWKGGFPGLSLQTQPNASGTTEMTAGDLKSLRKEMWNYENGLQRWLALTGMEAKSLAPQVADPSAHVDIQVKLMCMTLGVPYRIFVGSEEAQLAGAQDERNWNKRIKKRRKKYVTSHIVRPVVERLMALGVLSFLEKFFVEWDDVFAPSKKERSEIAKNETEAMTKYVSGNLDTLIQPLEFLTHVMGYDTDIAEAILENANLQDDGTLDRPEDPVAAAKLAQIEAGAGGGRFARNVNGGAYGMKKRKKKRMMSSY